jgi:hypothetical protein
MFDIKTALSLTSEVNDTRTLQEWGVKARLYKSNQALLVSMPMGTSAFHLGDERFVNIEMLEGAVKVSIKETNYYLTAGTDVSALLGIPSAYKITALADCKLLVLARAAHPASSFSSPEEHQKWRKRFEESLEIPVERLAGF